MENLARPTLVPFRMTCDECGLATTDPADVQRWQVKPHWGGGHDPWRTVCVECAKEGD